MEEDSSAQHSLGSIKPLNTMLMLAAFVIIVTGMHYATPILVPVLMAIFISILCTPLQRFLIHKGLPETLAVTLIITLLVIGAVLLVIFVGASMNEFSNQLPVYQKQLEVKLSDSIDTLQNFGLQIPNTDLKSILHADTAVAMATNVLRKVSALLTNFALISLTVVFILLEASSFKHKIKLAFTNSQDSLDSFEAFMVNVNNYLAIKTIFSLLTGFIIAIGLMILGVNHAPLWGLIAFLLNFIPNIGSFIAAAPAIALALIQLGPAGTLLVTILYLTTNMILGNLLEPRFMGKGLGLSTLVVFLSLIFWGAILGPVGMVLSIPLTMIVKMALEHNEETRWLAILLGPGSFAKKELDSSQQLEAETQPQ